MSPEHNGLEFFLNNYINVSIGVFGLLSTDRESRKLLQLQTQLRQNTDV